MQGIFKVTCANEASMDWLIESVRNMDLLGGHTYMARRLQDLPVLKRASVFVPGIPAEPSRVLHRLQRQNAELRTAEWRVIHRDIQIGKGQLLILGVDEDSISALRCLGFKPFYELSRLTFTVTDRVVGGPRV